ncbi:MAG TPA: hypothetical protein VFS25_16160 [Chitinophaga sp.]|uniref:hypothetical protein n=1 Tax=Chitinophaga sp. TaxID=1869181 RepID=UPI002DB7EA49|nr:hypothetical protein [Chitinophaga sp.]HEU4554382.1 hypothetical protein [Chitinophaga sp.]
MKTVKLSYAALIVLLCCFSFCSPLISRYNEYAYQQTTALKVDALQVMDMAADSFTLHKDDLSALQTKIDKAYEYEIHRPNNKTTIEMWQLLRSPDQHLLGGYFKYWQQHMVLNRDFIEEAKVQVGAAFDKIAELESGKNRP